MKRYKKSYGYVKVMYAFIALSIPSYAQLPGSAADETYLNMPTIAPIGVRIGKYLEIKESAKGAAIDVSMNNSNCLLM